MNCMIHQQSFDNPLIAERMLGKSSTAFWRSFDRFRLPWELRLSRSIKKDVFNPALDDVVSSIRDNGGVAVDLIIDRHMKRMKDLYEKHYRAVEIDFAGRAAIVEASLKFGWKIDVTRGPVAAWTFTQIGQNIKRVSDRTKDMVRGTVVRGLRDGLTLDAIARSIKKNETGFSQGRAFVVARTETHAAANAGGFFQLREDFDTSDLIKRWLNSGDERVRESHTISQTRDYDQPFKLDGGELMFPGDASLGVDAAEIIACRCTWYAKPKRKGVKPRRVVAAPQPDSEALAPAWTKPTRVSAEFDLAKKLEDKFERKLYTEDKTKRILDKLKDAPGWKDLDNETRYLRAGRLIGRWDATSADTDSGAIAFQKAIQVEFGLSEDTVQFLKLKPVWNDALIEFQDKEEFYRSFARVIYNDTQDWLKENGIEEVFLYRGMGKPGNVAGSVVKNANMVLQPASSFSTSYSEAASFTYGEDKVIMAGVVPRERIIGLNQTSLGTFDEKEVVVLAGDSSEFLTWQWGDRSGRPRDESHFKSMIEEAMKSVVKSKAFGAN